MVREASNDTSIAGGPRCFVAFPEEKAVGAQTSSYEPKASGV